MKIFAIADLHLSFAMPGKSQERFGTHWRNHPEKIEARWRERVAPEDLVLVPGDISWAMRMEQAEADLAFLARLPGMKVLVKGNHDFWWTSQSRVRQNLPPGLHILHADALALGHVIVGGTRFWTNPAVSFSRIIAPATPRAEACQTSAEDDIARTEKLFAREMGRLERALQAMSGLAREKSDCLKVLMTHFPPCDAAGTELPLTHLIDKHAIAHVVFGHLHNVRSDRPAQFGPPGPTRYHLVSSDYVDFTPKHIATV